MKLHWFALTWSRPPATMHAWAWCSTKYCTAVCRSSSAGSSAAAARSTPGMFPACLKVMQKLLQRSAARVGLKAQCMPTHNAPQRSIFQSLPCADCSADLSLHPLS